MQPIKLVSGQRGDIFRGSREEVLNRDTYGTTRRLARGEDADKAWYIPKHAMNVTSHNISAFLLPDGGVSLVQKFSTTWDPEGVISTMRELRACGISWDGRWVFSLSNGFRLTLVDSDNKVWDSQTARSSEHWRMDAE